MSHDDDARGWSTDTKCIHAGQAPDGLFGAVAPPIYQTSTFAFESCDQGAARFAGKDKGYIYTRLGNPTTKLLEDNLAALEEGAGALATASGMAAISTLFFSLLSAGDHVVCSQAVYGPSRLILERDFSRFGVSASMVETSDSAAMAAAVTGRTRMIYIETPSNPTLAVTDIAEASRLAKATGAFLVVDNTFCSPVLQRPIRFGADVVVHSVTKFINGHADVVGGVMVFATEELMKRVKPALSFLGGTMDPHQAWLVLRGVKTLGLRVRAAQENAKALAPVLAAHPAVSWVAYPGLPGHPQAALIAKQMEGPGSLISFELKGGLDAGKKLLESLKVATLAVSLGGVETLIQHPASMTHAGMPREARITAGITDGLVRLSVGCESTTDILADFQQGLDLLS
jgi:methionine-gamma-lyase